MWDDFEDEEDCDEDFEDTTEDLLEEPSSLSLEDFFFLV